LGWANVFSKPEQKILFEKLIPDNGLFQANL